jgi:hypothetical protein
MFENLLYIRGQSAAKTLSYNYCNMSKVHRLSPVVGEYIEK